MNYFDYSVTIIIPTYNRKKFEKLIEYNINSQDYSNIKEIIILDDSDKDDPLCIKTLYPIKYLRVPRVSIGEKRNYGVRVATSNYICMMDTDDFYNPEYISKSIFNLIKEDKNISGSADMIVYDKIGYYKQRCMFLHMLNEATLVFKKTNNINFNNNSSNEAIPWLIQNIPNIIETEIDNIMCCISHNENTICKKIWCSPKYNYIDLNIKYENHLKILSTITI
jgi:glycosyltransferase involved in cell wall biosynthesis